MDEHSISAWAEDVLRPTGASRNVVKAKGQSPHVLRAKCYWDADSSAILKRLTLQGLSQTEIAEILRRSPRAIRHKQRDFRLAGEIPPEDTGHAIWGNPENIELLKRLHNEGASAGRIAAELGATRNTVAGKIYRLRAAGEIGPAEIVRRRPAATVPRVARERPQKPKTKARADAIRHRLIAGQFIDEPPPTPPPLESMARLGFMELEAHHCRWPVGEVGAEDFFFCGLNAVPDRPYCAHHNHIARQTRVR